MKLEPGKYYRTADGTKVGPMCEENPRWSGWPFDVKDGPLNRCLWKDDGTCDEGAKFNIVSEWPDEPLTLWRDMTQEQKGALLLAHHEGKVIESTHKTLKGWISAIAPSWHPDRAYRVKHKPVVQTVTRYFKSGDGTFETHRITFNLIDNEPDCYSIKMEKM
jgi:hypothetical protein